jgi:hypothetical protein
MMDHTCQGMTLGDHSRAICTICGADLNKGTFNQLMEAIERVRDLHRPVLNDDDLVCMVCLADGGEEAMIYPCDTIIVLNGGHHV